MPAGNLLAQLTKHAGQVGNAAKCGQLCKWTRTRRISFVIRFRSLSGHRTDLPPVAEPYWAVKADDAKRLKKLQKENARPKRIVTDQAFDIEMLKELIRGVIRNQGRGRLPDGHI